MEEMLTDDVEQNTPNSITVHRLVSSQRSTPASNGNHPAVLSVSTGARPITTPALPLTRESSTAAPVLPLGQAFQAMPVADREQLIRQQISQLIMQSAVRTASGQSSQHQANQNIQRGHTHSHPHVLPLRHAVPTSQGEPSGGQASEMVLDMEDVAPVIPQNAPPAQPGQAHQHEHGPSQGRGRRRRQLGDQLQGIPGIGPILHNLEGAVPFIILIFAKVMYNHRLGLLVFAAMFGTFYYANSSFKRLIALRDNQTWTEALSGYIWIFGFLASNILFIYFVFADQQLYNCLYFQSAEVEDLDLWNLLWITVITDFVVKFATIAVKSGVAVLPKHILAYKKKGKYFLLLETISQFYRCLIPIKHWMTFMLDKRSGGEWVAVVLFLVYCVVKTYHLRKKFYELKRAVAHCRVDTPFGSSPNREEMKAFDDTCPICQDIFSDAIKLTCKHVFCDECICLWLDREKTCPMCRAQIVDNPIWRDGATSALVQFY